MLYHSRLDGSLSIGYDSHGRAQRYTDSARGQLALTLDALARQTQETGPHGQSATSWDAASQRTRLSANFQSEAAQAISASWDAGGRLQTLTSPEGASQFTHDAAGRLTGITRANGAKSSYSYNAAGHLAEIHHQGPGSQSLAKFSYTHDANGRRTAATEDIAGQSRTVSGHKKMLAEENSRMVNGWSSPETSTHIWDALMGNGGTLGDVPYPLSFILIKGPGRDDVASSIRNSSLRCGNRPVGYDCDEYPYASTFNGGNLMYELGGVSLRAVRQSDNRAQGSKLRWFYSKNDIGIRDPFINLSIPFATNFHIDKHGKAHL